MRDSTAKRHGETWPTLYKFMSVHKEPDVGPPDDPA